MQQNPERPARHAGAGSAQASGLSVLPYVLVLAGVAAGLFVAFQGPRDAGRGIGLIAATLLAAVVARLALPPRYAGLLASRSKAIDVVTLLIVGGAMLGFALSLPLERRSYILMSSKAASHKQWSSRD